MTFSDSKLAAAVGLSIALAQSAFGFSGPLQDLSFAFDGSTLSSLSLTAYNEPVPETGKESVFRIYESDGTFLGQSYIEKARIEEPWNTYNKVAFTEDGTTMFILSDSSYSNNTIARCTVDSQGAVTFDRIILRDENHPAGTPGRKIVNELGFPGFPKITLTRS